MASIRERIDNLSEDQKRLLVAHLESYSADTQGGSEALVAYCVFNGHPDEEGVLNRLETRLPAYMLPNLIVSLDKIPRLPNGKIDTRSLPEADFSVAEPGGRQPNSEVEENLSGIWEEILGITPVNADDNFFEIGGDSIMSIQIAAKARQQGILIEPNQLFEHQTIRELAKNIEDPSQQISRPDRNGEIPLTPIQHWFFEEHKNSPNHWNQAILVRPRKKIDPQILRKSVEELVKRHENLRMVFPESRGKRTARLERPAGSPLVTAKVQGLSGPEADAEILSQLKKQQGVFDLSNGPLFRVILLESPNEQGVLLVAHHLIVDPMSWGILLSDLEMLYLAIENGDQFAGYVDTYSSWIDEFNNQASDRKFDQQLDYWKTQLSGGRKLEETVSFSPPVLERQIATERLRISNLGSGRNRDRNSGSVVEQNAVISVFEALSKSFGVNELCIGLERQLRLFDGQAVPAAGIAGWFTSFFPVALSVDEDMSFEERVSVVRSRLGDIPDNGVGFGLLKYVSKSEELSSGGPAVLINFLGERLNYEGKLFGDSNLPRDGLRSPESERYRLLDINICLDKGDIEFELEYPRDLFTAEFVRKVLTRVEVTWNKLVRDGDQSLADDYSESGLNESDLEKLLGQIK